MQSACTSKRSMFVEGDFAGVSRAFIGTAASFFLLRAPERVKIIRHGHRRFDFQRIDPCTRECGDRRAVRFFAEGCAALEKARLVEFARRRCRSVLQHRLAVLIRRQSVLAEGPAHLGIADRLAIFAELDRAGHRLAFLVNGFRAIDGGFQFVAGGLGRRRQRPRRRRRSGGGWRVYA